MKRIWLAMALLLLVVSPSWAGQKPAVLRFAHVHAETDFVHIYALEWGKKVAERTNGAVVIEVYANSQLGGVIEDLLEQQRQGSNLACNADAGRAATFVPEFASISAPYVIENYEQLAAVGQLPSFKKWLKELEDEHDLTIAAWNWSQGYRHVYANKYGKSPKEFANISIRCAESPLWVETVKTLGGIPVVLPYSDQYTGIQTKIVDGCEQSVGTVFNMKLYEVAKYMVETRHIFMGNFIIMGTKWLRTLSPEHQKILLEECVAAGEELSKAQAVSDLKYLDEMVKAGLTVIPYSELDIEAFKKNAEPSYEALGILDAITVLKNDLKAIKR